MTKIDWEHITNYIESVGSTDTNFPFSKPQSSVKVTASGATANIIYTIGGQSGTLTPGQSVTVTGSITSMTLRSASGQQPFQVWAVEANTEQDYTDVDIVTSLAQNVSQLQGIVVNVKYPPAPLVAAKGNGTTDDTDAVNAIISYVSGLGGGSVYFPPSTYLLAKKTGTVEIPAHDDGTVQSGYGTTMSPETVNYLNYSVRVRPNVKLVGHDEVSTILLGNYVYGNADLNQTIMLSFVGETAGSAIGYCGIESLQIKNAFFGYAALNNTITVSNFKQLSIQGCAIGLYMQVLERCRFEEIVCQASGSMLVVGGQWFTRNNQKQEKGGFADKCYFNKITFQYALTIGTADQAIDTFFDTYFFKTANNGTRLSTPIDPTSPATLLTYRGICGTCINILPRYWRPSNHNDFNNIFHAVSPRYVIYGGSFRINRFNNINVEQCGYQTSTSMTNPVGAGWNDPYLGSNIKLPAYIVGTDNTCLATSVQVYTSYCQQAVDNNLNYQYLDVGASTVVNTTLPVSRQANATINTATITSPTITNGSLANTFTTNYHFVGDTTSWNSATVTSGSGTANLTLPEYGVYIVNVLAAYATDYNHSSSQSFVVSYFNGGTFMLSGSDGLGTLHTSGGSHSPTGLALSAPTTAGVITATASGCNTSTISIRFDVKKLSKA